MISASNPLDVLENNGYNVTDFIYPIDLTTDPGENHMVLFYINESVNTQFQTTDQNGNLQYIDNGKAVTRPAGSATGGTSPTPLGPDGKPAQATVNSSDNVTTFNKRPVSRVSSLIALYMPPIIQTSYTPIWESTETNATGGALKALLGQNASVRRALGEVAIGIASNLAEDSKDFLSTLGVDAPVADLVSLATRAARNPHLEMLFRSVGFREYSFDFKFAPRSTQEARTVDNIIKAFRFYSAPEIRTSKNAGRYYIYPAEFDIEFWSNGKQNNFINKISSCACTGVGVNFTGSGAWSAFRATGDKNGMSVETHLSLQFKELEIITKERVLQGF